MAHFWEVEREPDELEGGFEFMSGVSVEATEQDADGEWQTETWFTVRLPHQCDYWEITRSLSKATAIEEMEQFIAEAQAALEKLKDAS